MPRRMAEFSSSFAPAPGPRRKGLRETIEMLRSEKRAGWLALLWVAAALGIPALSCRKGSEPSSPKVMVGAAASLRSVLPELIDAFRAGRGAVEIAVTYGASGDLRKQVEAGAPLD